MEQTPLLIMGSPRSGTTFLSHMVNEFFDIHVCRDNGTLLRFHGNLAYYEPLSDPANLRWLLTHLFADHYFQERLVRRGLRLGPDEIMARVSRPTYGALIDTIFGAIAAEHGKRMWGYKRASFARVTGRQIDELFPTTKFVHIIRDAREVALSMRRSGAALERSWHFAALDWVSHVTTGRFIGSQIGPERYLEIRYERFMAEPAEVLVEILDFFGTGADHDERAVRIQREIPDLVKKGNTEKWRRELSASGVRAVERVAGPLLTQLGYPLVNPEVSGSHVGMAENAWLQTERVCRNLLQTRPSVLGRYRLEVLKAQWRARLRG